MSRVAVPFELGGVGIELFFPDAGLATAVREIWCGFERGDSRRDLTLAIDVVVSDRAPSRDAGDPRRTAVRRQPDGAVTIDLAEGHVRIDADGRARLTVARGPDHVTPWHVHNLVLPAIAWTFAAKRRGALVHGAAVVVGGRGYVLVGAEGSGKSTFARTSSGGGATVLGEDLTLIDGSGDRLAVVTSPYRTESATHRGPGRWPLGAVLLPRHGAEPRLDEVSRGDAVAAVAANLPFLAPDEASIEIASDLVSRCAVRRLTFAPDDRFVTLLAAGGPCGGPTPRR